MKALNVLVVDDAAFIRDLIKKGIRDAYPGFKIHEAIDGRKAQSILKSNSIDLILCDWEMPEMSGLELLTWLRTEERYEKTPFMMITSRGERDHVIKAVQAGVSDYIGKPFTKENFLQKVDKLLRKHGIKSQAAAASSSPQDASVAALTGGAAPASPKKAAEPTGASLLMGGTPQAKPAQAKPVATDAASLLTGGAPQPEAKPKRAEKSGGKAKGVAEIRFGSGGGAKCVIKDINLQEMSGVFKREDNLPQLLEQVVLDIVDQEAGQVARINCYIRSLSAVENNVDAKTINVIIRYVDDDPVKLDTLSRFIAKVR